MLRGVDGQLQLNLASRVFKDFHLRIVFKSVAPLKPLGLSQSHILSDIDIGVILTPLWVLLGSGSPGIVIGGRDVVSAAQRLAMQWHLSCTVRQTDRQTDGRTDGRTDGQTDRQTDRCKSN